MMSWADHAVEELAKGNEVWVRPKGNSMAPLINSGDRVLLHPIEDWRKLFKGSEVLVKFRGRYLLHKITAFDGDRVQISNNRGRVNGWVNRSAVLGLAIDIERMS